MKQDRLLEIFFRSLRGESISVKKLAAEKDVSRKSISRDINELENFFCDHRDLVGNTELRYSHQDHSYHLFMDEFLTSNELFSLIEVLIGARAFSKTELLIIVEKMKRFTTLKERQKLHELIRKEIYHYPEVKHNCESVQSFLWQLGNCILDHQEISIEYCKMDKTTVIRRLRPVAVMFTDFYFYLIGFLTNGKKTEPHYFRIDRINQITIHRKKFTFDDIPEFDEGLLRERSLYMWPGIHRTIRFEFSGPSIQAVLDKIPTAKIIEKKSPEKYLIEADVYGDGIKMWLLSQGSWVKVTEPKAFVKELTDEISKMLNSYNIDDA